MYASRTTWRCDDRLDCQAADGSSYADAQAVLDDLAALGIDYDDVVQALEDQGVTTFDASWDHLGQRLATALGTRQE